MVLRIITKNKEKLFITFVCLMVIVSFIYLYLIYVQENKNDYQSSEQRIISELESIKYQLIMVTEYKDKIEKSLSETQKQHQADKERFKDIMESCVAMKQQSTICQSQFEDLQLECKKVKESNILLNKELEKLKTPKT